MLYFSAAGQQDGIIALLPVLTSIAYEYWSSNWVCKFEDGYHMTEPRTCAKNEAHDHFSCRL